MRSVWRDIVWMVTVDLPARAMLVSHKLGIYSRKREPKDDG